MGEVSKKDCKNYKHTFVICAFKESPYLYECIRSLKKQKNPSIIKLATSTPSDFLKDICKEFDIEYCVRDGVSGISADWNYAYSVADTDYVTIAHQDDIYYADYSGMIEKYIDDNGHTLIAFTDYSELKGDKRIDKSLNLMIKRFLLIPIRNEHSNHLRWRKRWILRFGNAVCCPSVTYNKKALDKILLKYGRNELFQSHFRSNLDWEMWEWLSNRRGSFVYIPGILMSHRIHMDSETSATIRDNQRGAEDYEMFVKFWPEWISRLISKAYGESEREKRV